MDMQKHIDLLITDGDFSLNSGLEPELCSNRYSIGQDVVHSILESGLGLALIAERCPTLRADIIMQIELLVEDDVRLIPGTVEVKEETAGRLFITAQTYEFGGISAYMEQTA